MGAIYKKRKKNKKKGRSKKKSSAQITHSEQPEKYFNNK